MPEKLYISWDEFHRHTRELAQKLKANNYNKIVAVSRGGLLPAGILAYELNIRNVEVINMSIPAKPLIFCVPDFPGPLLSASMQNGREPPRWMSMSGIFPTFGWFSLGIKQALLYVMLANICVEHRYEVSLYRHSAFFTTILVFFLCHYPAFYLCYCPIFSPFSRCPT